MKRSHALVTLIAIAVFVLSSATHVAAQSLRDQMAGIFSDALELQLAGSPGAHGKHFSPNNVAASGAMINALGNFVAAATGNFSFSSTAAGISFDLSTGVPVRTTTSLGPIFAERAQTLGRKRVNVGWNFTYLSQGTLRGTDLSDIQFTFTHQDVGLPGLGDSDNELDTIDLAMNLDINSSILVFFTSYGVSERLDVGFALPVVNMEISADPVSIIQSFTLLANDSANHYYGGTTDAPVLTYNGKSVKDDANGIGDILLRAKYYLMKRNSLHMAALLDLRLATGDETDFLGAGSSSYRLMWIVSGDRGDFAPHLNVGYNLRTSDVQRDDVEFIAGFDQKVTDDITFASDVIGRVQTGGPVADLYFPQTASIARPAGSTMFNRTVQLTNLQNYTRDDTVDLSAGFRFAPKPSIMLLGNVIVPLNRGGLRSGIIPTFGVEFTL